MPTAATLEICNQSDFQTLLHPAASNQAASAFWLNRQLIQWPQIANTGNFKLYYSTNGQLVAATGNKVSGADNALALTLVDTKTNPVPEALRTRFKYLPDGVVLSVKATDAAQLQTLHKQQVLLVQENANGEVVTSTALQIAGAMDDLYAPAAALKDLGVSVNKTTTHFRVWAPTAQQVSVCIYPNGSAPASVIEPLTWNDQTGSWSVSKAVDLSGSYYQYVVDVYVRGVGLVRNRVTDPYSVGLTADSKRSYIIDLNDPKVTPKSGAKPLHLTR